MAQQLTACQTMTARSNLTSLHDMSCAWTGIGSAASSLLQQRRVRVSFWMTFCITVYLACISALHISSSSIMKFQTFNHTVVNMVQSTLAWPSPSVSLQDLNWTNITPLLTVIETLPTLSTTGLFSNTLYDIISTAPGSFNAAVNATTVNAYCGLLSNLSFWSNPSVSSINSSVFPTGTVTLINVPTMCKSLFRWMLVKAYTTF